MDRRRTQVRPNDVDTLLILASSQGYAGKTEEARATIDECSRIEPDFEPNPWPMQFLSQHDKDHFLDGLRKAGWGG